MTSEEFVNRPRPAPPHVTSSRVIGEAVGDALEVGMVARQRRPGLERWATPPRREAIRLRLPWQADALGDYSTPAT